MRKNAATSDDRVLNVLGQPLEPCSFEPLTGFFRDGFCKTNFHDTGLHLVCASVSKEFLEFTKQRGNDLMTKTSYFPGLRPGDRWCLCVKRWEEAMANGAAPPIHLASTNERALRHVDLDTLKLFSDDV